MQPKKQNVVSMVTFPELGSFIPLLMGPDFASARPIIQSAQKDGGLPRGGRGGAGLKTIKPNDVAHALLLILSRCPRSAAAEIAIEIKNLNGIMSDYSSPVDALADALTDYPKFLTNAAAKSVVSAGFSDPGSAQANARHALGEAHDLLNARLSVELAGDEMQVIVGPHMFGGIASDNDFPSRKTEVRLVHLVAVLNAFLARSEAPLEKNDAYFDFIDAAHAVVIEQYLEVIEKEDMSNVDFASMQAAINRVPSWR